MVSLPQVVIDIRCPSTPSSANCLSCYCFPFWSWALNHLMILMKQNISLNVQILSDTTVNSSRQEYSLFIIDMADVASSRAVFKLKMNFSNILRIVATIILKSCYFFVQQSMFVSLRETIVLYINLSNMPSEYLYWTLNTLPILNKQIYFYLNSVTLIMSTSIKTISKLKDQKWEGVG